MESFSSSCHHKRRESLLARAKDGLNSLTKTSSWKWMDRDFFAHWPPGRYIFIVFRSRFRRIFRKEEDSDPDFCFIQLFLGTRVGSKGALDGFDFDFLRGFRLDLEGVDFLDVSFGECVDFLDVSLLDGSVDAVVKLVIESCPSFEKKKSFSVSFISFCSLPSLSYGPSVKTSGDTTPTLSNLDILAFSGDIICALSSA